MTPSAFEPRVTVFEDSERLAYAAAERLIELASKAIERVGRFSIALAGGTTPRRVYEMLASERYRVRTEWSRWHIFFGDERGVPPDATESNFRMANETLLGHVPVPARNIHRMRGEGDVVANARAYEDEMRAYFGPKAWPDFDLVLLGMGDDGHTASLFPHTPALNANETWVAANWVDKLDAYRLTLTAAAINHARHVLFLVAGDAKAERLQEVLKGPHEPERLPAQSIAPIAGALEWFVDRASANGL